MSDLITGVPHDLDAQLRRLCGELRDLGNSLEGISTQLQTAPEHVNPHTLAELLPEAQAGVEKIREYRRLLGLLWESQR